VKSLLDDRTREQVLKRLDALAPDSKPDWGRMNVSAMLCHLTESIRMATGELPVRGKNKGAFTSFPLKHLILYVLPFPKGVRTAPELLARAPEGFVRDRATLHELTTGFASACQGGARHPLFGVLSKKEWGVLQWRHMDRHLRQFKV